MINFGKILNWIKRVTKRDSEQVRSLKGALGIRKTLCTPGDNPENQLSEIIFDYPLLVDLCKAYIDDKEYDSALEIVKTCFKIREQYTQFGGRREAYLIKLIAKDLIKNGREDIAQKVLRKVRNFEGGVPVHQLSEVFVPDRELLKKALEEWDLKARDEDKLD